ncbi:hypothetical protein AMTRI_Chr04g188490 [Amborella trichopoda]
MKAQMTTAKSYEHDAKCHGCGILVLYGFGRRKLWPRRSSSTGSKDTRGQMGILISRRRRRDAVADYYHNRQNSSMLVRASSSNMMVFSYLDNIRQAQPQNFQAIEYTKPKPQHQQQQRPSKYGYGSVVRGGGAPPLEFSGKGGGDPEALKNMGNKEYKKGRFAEALALYETAIALDPDRASYRSNKGAALMGLGRLLEAVDECREAAGVAEKAMAHYKQSVSEANAGELGQAQAFQTHLSKCTEARKLKDWHTLLKEASSAIATGADAAPQVFASQAEALLRLHKVQEAEAAMSGAPEFEVDACTKFDIAVSAAQRAGILDRSNMGIGAVVRKARGVSSARSNGNDLFKASRFSEACLAHGDGLQSDPLNTILLCNRAACRSKMGQWERAIEDCTAALNIRPSCTKARLLRADGNAKVSPKKHDQKVGEVGSINTRLEILNVECPGDTEVEKALLEVKQQLNKCRGEDVKENISNVVLITNGDRSRQYVDTEENPNLSKSEGVSSVPAFKIYRNGSQVKDIAGSNPQLLESSIQYYSS